MQIIPVIDLLDGQVVHAKRGDRQHYMPIQSSLCSSSAPLDIIAALFELYPFTTLYIADINAIQSGAIQSGENHFQQLGEIKHRYPNLDIWLDSGFDNTGPLQQAIAQGVQAVLGSESLSSMEVYERLSAICQSRHILSLDFKTDGQQNRFHGPAALHSNSSRWPSRVIAMTLDKVGSDAGPDFMQLKNILQEALTGGQALKTDINATLHKRKIYAAGGVRHQQDLTELKRMGIAGVLIASALHSGMLNKRILEDIQHACP